MSNNMTKWLDYEVDSFPARASGEELYEYFEKLAERAITEDRNNFVATMMQWLQLRSEPKTMIAVEIAGTHQVSELKDELELLLSEVVNGKAFKQYYDKPIRKSLAKI